MLWKDFKEEESCDNCPLLKAEICTGGYQCYGGEPVEPPCCGFDDDTDLEEWVENHHAMELAYEDAEEKRIRKERQRKERAQKAADTRREMRDYCFSEILDLKRAQKALRAQKRLEDFLSGYAEAINFANEAFQYNQRVTTTPELSEKVKELEREVAAAQEKYDAKRKQFYAERKKTRQREA